MTDWPSGPPAERALRESEERFRLLMLASSEMIYQMSADWSRMYSMVGKGVLADTTVPSASWLENYIPDGEKVVVQAEIDKAIRGKTLFELEHRVVREDGTVGWTLSRAIPVLDEQGEIVEWFGSASDITERKRAGEALQALNATLEMRVEERTRRLADLNAELGNLITRTAHNLEEPARQLSHLLEVGGSGDPHALGHLPSYDPVALSDEVKRLKGVALDLRRLSILEEHPLTKEPLPLGELFAELSVTPPGSDVTWQIGALLQQALSVLLTFTLSETRGARYVTVSSRQIEGEV